MLYRLGVFVLVALTVLLSLASLGRPAQPASATPPLAQITAPSPGFKLRQERSVPIRIRVAAGSAAVRQWKLAVVSADDSTVEVTRGDGPVEDTVAADLSSSPLRAGAAYGLRLTVEDVSDADATAEIAFSIPDPQYTLIPLEAGNLARSALGVLSMDQTGTLVTFGGRPGEPPEIFLADTQQPAHTLLAAPLGATEGAKLTADGARFFFVGSFTQPMALGFGFLDRVSQSITLIGHSTFGLFTVDHSGRRVAFQEPVRPGGRDPVLQYFQWDEATQSRRQLTDAPDAIVITDDPLACPRPRGTTPLITADGHTVVLITASTLGQLEPDPQFGCHIFTYDVPTSELRHVTSLPRHISLDDPVLSADGTLLSFVSVRPAPPRARQPFPALVDMRTGAVTDPIGDVTGSLSFDSAVVRTGTRVVISSQADLDHRIRNADRNLELFIHDISNGTFEQITETTLGIGSAILTQTQPIRCPGYRPAISSDGSVVALAFNRFTGVECPLDGPQRNESDGFVFGFVRAVRKRSGNAFPVLPPIEDVRVAAGETLTLTFTATDPDDDPITFFAQVVDGMDVPPGSVIEDHHDGTATFTWPTTPENVGDYRLRVAAFDEGGGEVFHDFTITVAPEGRPPDCAGDCNGDQRVTVEELVAGVNVALDRDAATSCRRLDTDQNARVTVDELVTATRHALTGCAG